jgi:uncharacterized protein
MKTIAPERLAIEAGKAGTVSALLLSPKSPRTCFVFAHGAGAGMTHPFMERFAIGLCERGIASLRYQFPYMENGSKRPDAPAVAQATVRAAVAMAAKTLPRLPLIAGGKSFGGRMTSQAQAIAPLEGVGGLAFVGFPLHASGKPSTERAEHLNRVEIPMLFLQGSRDTLSEAALIETVVKRLGPLAKLYLVDGADHSFHVPARSGRKDADVMDEILDVFAEWAESL